MQLRTYQTSALQRVSAEYRSGKRCVCLVLPTGAGKTHTAVNACVQAASKGKSVLWLAHRSELIDQAIDAFSAQGMSAGAIAAGSSRPPRPYEPVQVASIQTLLARFDKRPERADLIVLDECHHFPAAEFRRVPEAYPQAHVLGLTATPERGDGQGLGELFDSLVVGVTTRELVDAGHLVRSEIHAPRRRLSPSEIAIDPLTAWRQIGKGLQTVVFCRTVDDAKAAAVAFLAAGVPAACVFGNTPGDERKRVLAAFARHEIRVLCNVMVLTEGWDVPSTACAIVARGVGTSGLWLQMVGRVLRPALGKAEAVIIDLAGSSIEHGHPEDDREYSLQGKGIRKAGSSAGRECPRCSAEIGGDDKCVDCGYDTTTAGREQGPALITGDQLVKYGAKLAEGPQERLNTLARWCQVATNKGYKPGWVANKYKVVYRESPNWYEINRMMGRYASTQRA